MNEVLKPVQREFLNKLASNNYKYITDIAKEMGVTKLTLYRHIPILIGKGYITIDKSNYKRVTVNSIKIVKKEEQPHEEII